MIFKSIKKIAKVREDIPAGLSEYGTNVVLNCESCTPEDIEKAISLLGNKNYTHFFLFSRQNPSGERYNLDDSKDELDLRRTLRELQEGSGSQNPSDTDSVYEYPEVPAGLPKYETIRRYREILDGIQDHHEITVAVTPDGKRKRPVTPKYLKKNLGKILHEAEQANLENADVTAIVKDIPAPVKKSRKADYERTLALLEKQSDYLNRHPEYTTVVCLDNKGKVINTYSSEAFAIHISDIKDQWDSVFRKNLYYLDISNPKPISESLPEIEVLISTLTRVPTRYSGISITRLDQATGNKVTSEYTVEDGLSRVIKLRDRIVERTKAIHSGTTQRNVVTLNYANPQQLKTSLEELLNPKSSYDGVDLGDGKGPRSLISPYSDSEAHYGTVRDYLEAMLDILQMPSFVGLPVTPQTPEQVKQKAEVAKAILAALDSPTPPASYFNELGKAVKITKTEKAKFIQMVQAANPKEVVDLDAEGIDRALTILSLIERLQSKRKDEFSIKLDGELLNVTPEKKREVVSKLNKAYSAARPPSKAAKPTARSRGLELELGKNPKKVIAQAIAQLDRVFSPITLKINGEVKVSAEFSTQDEAKRFLYIVGMKYEDE